MNWQQLLGDTLGAISVYGFLGMLINRVNAGVGSEAENRLVDDIKKVVSEYSEKALLDAKTAEQAEITEMQRRFNEKHGLMESGHIIGHVQKV